MNTHFSSDQFLIQSKDNIEEINNILDKRLYYVFDSFFQPNILKSIILNTQNYEFKEYKYAGEGDIHDLGSELIIDKKIGIKTQLLMQNKELFRFIEKTFKLGSISSFNGRIYSLPLGSDYQLKWHEDSRIESRKLAISINLSLPAYNNLSNGGEFCIRKIADPDNTYQEFRNSIQGQAVIFKVLPGQTEHRVKPVTTDAPRTHFTGWFNT